MYYLIMYYFCTKQYIMNLRIKEILKEKNKSAVWLAAEIGITQPSMSNIVNNKVSPSLETLEKISSALECDISDFFNKNNSIKCPHCGKEIKVKIE